MSSQREPTRDMLRQRLKEICPLDEDLESFCIDHFHDVYKRFSAGLNRVQKENLLLSAVSPVELLERIQRVFPKRVEDLPVESKNTPEDILLSSEWNGHYLQQVRHAYRLVHRFQRRIFDMISIISAHLQSLGMKFHRWDTYNFPSPPRANIEFFGSSCWAWQFLPAYGVECIWESRIEKEKDARRVVLELQPDDGWHIVDSAIEPDPQKFAHTDKTKTMLFVSLYKSDDVTLDFYKAWKKIEHSREPDIYNGHDHLFEIDTAQCIYRYFEIDIVRLVGNDDIKNFILEPLSAWMNDQEF